MDLSHYPRPDFRRERFMLLDGIWDFDFDDEDRGLFEKWYLGHDYKRKIKVPFVYQAPLSGLGIEENHNILWYSRKFEYNLTSNKHLHLSIGASDYKTDVFINGEHVATHIGGYTPFSADITFLLKKGENNITVRVLDYPDPAQLRGKQYWKTPDRCWYKAHSGIWQSVWLEERDELYIECVHFTPSISDGSVKIHTILSSRPNNAITVNLDILFKGCLVNKVSFLITEREGEITLPVNGNDYIDEDGYWSPDNPVLYDVDISLSSGDKVSSYFGMREVEVRDGIIFLNNRPLYQRLVLDQGYYSDGHVTARTNEDYINDLSLVKSMGFNGVRMHQKIEDPRFYYQADRLGVLVWGELPSGYIYSDKEREEIIRSIELFICRDYNHPSIITWVPLNESWGVRKIALDKATQNFANTLYSLIKSLDPTRLVDTNDGWEQVESDILGIHDYVKDGEGLKKHWENPEKTLKSVADWRPVYSKGYSYKGEPVILSEFGGIAFLSDETQGWGYSGVEKDERSFLLRLGSLIDALRANPLFQGFCYTQLFDTYQEVNGLLTQERKIKVDIEKLREIFSK